MGVNSKNKTKLPEILENKILVSDGAMGTLLQESGHKGSPDSLNLNVNSVDFKKIIDIHLSYLEAGSDIIMTNTLGSNSIKLESMGLSHEIDKINKNAVSAAKQSIQLYGEKFPGKHELFIAGDIGPSGKLLEPYGELKYSSAVSSFAKQIDILIKTGIDFLIIETMMDIREALAAVEAARKINDDILVACTLTFKENGVTIMGNKAESIGADLISAGCDIIGANCGVGSCPMIDIVRKLRDSNPNAKLLVQPNAGLPVLVEGKTKFNETPEIMAANFKEILKYKPSIIGACCGSTPAHIKKIAELVKN
ncbi:MAG: homocysteine S-methyltransferase family protein [Actinobacteria bacterium]|nr:homocysteine S-methyltransferase family protein [Actinomycetota bacterium]